MIHFVNREFLISNITTFNLHHHHHHHQIRRYHLGHTMPEHSLHLQITVRSFFLLSLLFFYRPGIAHFIYYVKNRSCNTIFGWVIIL